ncbi:MAG TPA: hypothetical protein VJ969_11040, partial [Desulfopila sp.]|nr:hypothetical protein [Desulfopila sp.]
MNTEGLVVESPWFSSYDDGVSKSLEYENLLLPQFLEKSAEAFPKKIALQFQGYEMTYRDLSRLVSVFATVLEDFGIGKGD